ncbi:recombinase family protein [Metabacillus elymi]
MREGDILIVYKLDRLGRTTRQLLELVDDLKERNIQFQSLSNGIDATTEQGVSSLRSWLHFRNGS